MTDGTTTVVETFVNGVKVSTETVTNNDGIEDGTEGGNADGTNVNEDGTHGSDDGSHGKLYIFSYYIFNIILETLC